MNCFFRQRQTVASNTSAAAVCFATLLSLGVLTAAETGATQKGFAAVLRTAGIDSASMAPLANWRGQWHEAEANAAQQILYRLNQLGLKERSQLALPAMNRSWLSQPSNYQGSLVSIRGRVVDAQELPKLTHREAALDSLRYRCIVELELDADAKVQKRIIVLVPQVPSQWRNRAGDVPLNEPVEFAGVVLGETDVQAAGVLMLSDHLAWYPDAGVPQDWILLAKLGYDVGLLDEVRQRRPFVKPEVSREGEAFQALLKAVRGTTAAELDLWAKQAVERRLPIWKQQVSKLQGKAAKRRALGIAQAAVQRGEMGLSSAAPMFLAPRKELGRLERLEGTARRAVRIVPEDSPGAAPYYELEIFMNDSQNLPVVCCAASLPEGFPTGDAIRAPVRVAGFFFKSWLYRSREEAPPLEKATKQAERPAVNLAPLVVIASPEWIRTTSSSPAAGWGMWAGILLLALVACVWWTLARAARNDRLARRRNRRYDSSL